MKQPSIRNQTTFNIFSRQLQQNTRIINMKQS